jgi:hypothetical protein
MSGSTGARGEKVFLIELSPSVPNLGKFIVMPRYGMLAIASILSERTDFDVSLLFEPYIGKIDIEKIAREEPRYILVNGITSTADRNEEFLGRLRDRLNGAVTVIAGGEHATTFPEGAKRYADYILAYEGDDTAVPLLSALEESDPVSRESLLSQIPGLHFRDRSGKWRFNREPARVQRIDYRYDLSVVPGAKSARRRFRQAHIPLQTSRGCRFSCSFCSWIGLYGKSGYHVRPVEDVLHDILHAVDYTGIRNFVVSDNLFGGDSAYTEGLMDRILRAFERREDKPLFTVLCRADQFAGGAGSLPETTIRLMARAESATSLGLSRSHPEPHPDEEKSISIPITRLRNACGGTGSGCWRRSSRGSPRQLRGRREHLRVRERIGLFTIQVYGRGSCRGRSMRFFRASQYPGRLDRYVNGHAVNILPALMLPSELQRAIFEAAFRFHGGGPEDRAERLPDHLERIGRTTKPS